MTESRFNVELRSEISGNTLRGYAAVFDQYADMRSHLEVLSRTAFDAALKDPSTDVRAFYNHDSGMILGRQSAGTLRISTDSAGLEFDLDIPDTSYGRDLRVSVERRDITGASFAFVAGEDKWSTRNGRDVRTHISVSKLIEISPVSLPAYQSTSVTLRSITDIPVIDGRTQIIRAKARNLL